MDDGTAQLRREWLAIALLVMSGGLIVVTAAIAGVLVGLWFP